MASNELTVNEELSSSGSETEEYDKEEEEEIDLIIQQLKSKGKKKAGRKPQWTTELTNDLIDIIISDEKLKKKLLLTNTKNSKNGNYYDMVIKEMKIRCEENAGSFNYTVKQTRDKFKDVLTGNNE